MSENQTGLKLVLEFRKRSNEPDVFKYFIKTSKIKKNFVHTFESTEKFPKLRLQGNGSDYSTFGQELSL